MYDCYIYFQTFGLVPGEYSAECTALHCCSLQTWPLGSVQETTNCPWKSYIAGNGTLSYHGPAPAPSMGHPVLTDVSDCSGSPRCLQVTSAILKGKRGLQAVILSRLNIEWPKPEPKNFYNYTPLKSGPFLKSPQATYCYKSPFVIHWPQKLSNTS